MSAEFMEKIDTYLATVTQRYTEADALLSEAHEVIGHLIEERNEARGHAVHQRGIRARLQCGDDL